MTDEQTVFWDAFLEEHGCAPKLKEILVTKMDKGCTKYGPWNPYAETRDFNDEIRQEILDGVNYAIMACFLAEKEPDCYNTRVMNYVVTNLLDCLELMGKVGKK